MQDDAVAPQQVEKKSAQGAALTTVGALLGRAAGLLATLWITHFVHKTEYGQANLALIVASVVQVATLSISVTPPYTEWSSIRGLSMSGKALRVTDAAELGRVFELMVSKFPQIGQFLKADDVEMALYRVDPEVVSILDYTQGFGHTEAANA